MEQIARWNSRSSGVDGYNEMNGDNGDNGYNGPCHRLAIRRSHV